MQAEKYLPFQDLWTEVCMFASQLLNHQMRQQLVESFSSSRIESDNVACKKKIHLTLCSLTFITSIISCSVVRVLNVSTVCFLGHLGEMERCLNTAGKVVPSAEEAV